jgi:hypothetical protein
MPLAVGLHWSVRVPLSGGSRSWERRHGEKEEENQNAADLHIFDALAETRCVEENQIDSALSFEKIAATNRLI